MLACLTSSKLTSGIVSLGLYFYCDRRDLPLKIGDPLDQAHQLWLDLDFRDFLATLILHQQQSAFKQLLSPLQGCLPPIIPCTQLGQLQQQI